LEVIDLLKLIDFIIGIFVFLGALYGVTLLVNELLGFSNIEAISLIIAFLMLGRVLIKISEKE
jgi:hypothetical protein